MFKFGSKNDVNIDYKCTLRLLDDNEILQCDFQRDHKGQYLVDYVCTQLNLIEKDYFGLRFVDQHRQRHWLDPTRSILRQIKGMQPIIFCFRIKFYPPDPHRLKEEITRYQVFLQLRRDLLHGRLYCSHNDSALLAAYVIQSELGDYDPDEHVGNYVSEFKLLLKQTTKCEEKIAEIHQTQLTGQVPAVSEMNFLRKACLLDTYGIDPHPVKDHRGVQLYLGVNHAGILTFQGSRKTHHFKWHDVQKLNYEGKMFIIHLGFTEDSRTKKHTIGFRCPTGSACRHLWRCGVEQRLFFTVGTSSDVPSVVTGGGFFSRGSRFRYSGRVEKEILEDTNMIKREPPHFVRNSLRSLSLRQKSASFSTPQPSQEINDDGFTIVTRPGHSTPMSEGHYSRDDDSAAHDYTPHDESYPLSHSSTYDEMLEPVEEDQELHGEGMAANYVPQDAIDGTNAPPDYYVGEGGDYHNHMDSNHHHHQQHQQQQQQQHYRGDRYGDGTANNDQEEETKMYASLAHAEDFDISSVGPTGVTGIIGRRQKYVRVFFPSFLVVIVAVSCFVLVLLESNSEFLSDVRKLPELVILRREYYEPVKEYVLRKIRAIFFLRSTR